LRADLLVEQGKQRILIRVKGDHGELNLSRRRIALVNIVCRIRSRIVPDSHSPSPDTISPPRVERVNAWASLKDVFDRLPTVPEDQLGEHVPHEWIRDHPGAQLPRQQ
jgi:hypothetical protein